MSDDFALRVEHVKKTYNSYVQKINIFTDITFQLKKGEFVAVVGPTGCGKTTLINLIAGLDRPESGNIFIDGTNISKLSDDKVSELRGRKIGIVFQVHNLLSEMNVYENVELPLGILGLNREERKNRVKDALELANISGYAPRKVKNLSVGERQMVALARAMVTYPDIILMDEPTEYLDPFTTDMVLSFIKSSNILRGKTVLVTTHRGKVTRAAERVISLKKSFSLMNC
jgi:putative ABC transport system ATP-binding protein